MYRKRIVSGSRICTRTSFANRRQRRGSGSTGWSEGGASGLVARRDSVDADPRDELLLLLRRDADDERDDDGRDDDERDDDERDDDDDDG